MKASCEMPTKSINNLAKLPKLYPFNLPIHPFVRLNQNNKELEQGAHKMIKYL